MIVPQYWAEARLQHRSAGKQVTVKRFGWSDAGEIEAKVHAEQRVAEAMTRVLAGSKEARRDPKVPYNGAEGVPIREEIISRHGNAVVTGNSYGARCLNTPNVLFADIDLVPPTAEPMGRKLFLAFAAVAVVVGVLRGSALLATGLFLLALVVRWPLVTWWRRFVVASRGGVERLALDRIEGFFSRHAEWGGRLYRTPAGFRLLATHRTFEPSDTAVEQALSALGTDRFFTLMCLRQNCFRARVSPKPWRMRFPDRLRPRPGVWPIAADKMHLRKRWVDAYEAAAPSFAACRFIKALGVATIHPDVVATQELHDRLSRAESALPIA